ncbi:MarR family winged helix-turn-helix transcriptional regulator [Alteromonas confluentis]|nr:MarR family transcriptional regulator [Alteromonas confluentis]
MFFNKLERKESVVNQKEIEMGRLGEFIGFRLRRVQNLLSKDFASATRKYNLRSGLFSSLSLISSNPGISQNELSAAVGLDKSTFVQVIDELEKRGLAKREKSKTDRRRHALFVTDEGQIFLNELYEIMAKTESAALKQLSPSELSLLKALLDRMYEVL